jgi:hypothetical protein
MSENDETLEVLLAHAAGGRSTLIAGLPAAFAAATTPTRPKRSREDALLLSYDSTDPNDIAVQRWGVIAPDGPGGDAALEAIRPLVMRREEEQGAKAIIHRVPPGMDRNAAVEWKEQVFHDENLREDEVPRYLLLLGDLDGVSLDLQNVMASSAFIGRLHAREPEGSRAYVEKIQRWEAKPPEVEPPELVCFVAGDGSAATTQGRRALVDPSLEIAMRRLPEGLSITHLDDPRALLDAASRERPGVLFSLCRGLGPPWESAMEQCKRQGALVVGPNGETLTADDVGSRPFMPGGLWLSVASFGAATPETSLFSEWLGRLAEAGTPGETTSALLGAAPKQGRAFLADLPLAALANPDGPLAVIGQADLAWVQAPAEKDPLARVIGRLILEIAASRARVGVGVDALQREYRRVNDELLAIFEMERDARESGREFNIDASRRFMAWIARNTLRSFMLLGDPAARLPRKPRKK